MQNPRRLRVWKKAFALALSVRQATNLFPKRGFADSKAQMLRSAESIVNNIVEGCGASTQKEFARFLEMSIKSSMELENQLELAHAAKVLPDSSWAYLGNETVDSRRMLCGLRKKVLSSDLSEPGGDAERATDNGQRETHNAPTREMIRTEESATHPVEKEPSGHDKAAKD